MDARGLVADRFELEAPVGAGGMGTVFRARDRQGGGRVAVKLLDCADAVETERFLREGAMLASLSHPGIVRYIAHGRTGSRGAGIYLAMEWIAGESLADRLAGDGLDVAESVRLARQVAEALAAAHALGVVHRDVKPANLLFVDGDLERVKLIDFGVARRVDEAERLTKTGTAMGTPGYMSPEQVRGRRGVDGRTDVFALGCVLWECLTGRPAFAGENDLGVQTKILLMHTPPLREVCPEAPAELEALLMSMLAKEPRQRGDAPEIAAALAALAVPVASPRRSAQVLDVGTRPSAAAPGGARLVYTVIAATPSVDGVTPGAAPGLEVAAVAERVAKQGASVDVLKDGSVVARLDAEASAEEAAARAARLALALRDGLPGRLVVVAASDLEDDSIGRATRLVTTSALAMIFSGLTPPDGGIRIDEVTAGFLRARFEVTRDASGWRLDGARP